MKIIKFLILLVLIILVILLHSRFKQLSDTSNLPNIKTYSQIKKYINGRIDNIGSAKTLTELKTALEKKDTGFRHTATHIFGELIYDKFGIKALTYCDDYYSYGCYHGFFIRAILENGIGIVKEMDKACLAKYGKLNPSCQHGLGHGLYEYYGDKRIIEALTVCKTSTTQQDLYGCMSGVFMAYNFPKIINEKEVSITARKFDKDNPYYPCPSLPGEFHYICYYELGQWWHSTYKDDFNLMGKLCLGIQKREEQDICLRGLSNFVADTSNFEVDKIISNCHKMPDLRSETICRLETVQSYLFANPKKRDQAQKLCPGLGKNFEFLCIEKINQSPW